MACSICTLSLNFCCLTLMSNDHYKITVRKLELERTGSCQYNGRIPVIESNFIVLLCWKQALFWCGICLFGPGTHNKTHFKCSTLPLSVKMPPSKNGAQVVTEWFNWFTNSDNNILYTSGLGVITEGEAYPTPVLKSGNLSPQWSILFDSQFFP